jgi:hypothetical protein
MVKSPFAPLPARAYPMIEPAEPVLYREQFPYTEVPRILFDGVYVRPEPAGEIWITDTTFRDGQQARPPYTPQQIVDIYSMLHRLGGPKGIIRQSEFFIYSKRDRAAVEGCQALGHKYPEITSWIRAHADDLKLVKEFGLKETGILTSCSDYHIYLKLKTTRTAAMEDYLSVVKEALAHGIRPRCHLEDVTRADIYGFCLPFAEKVLKLMQESGVGIKLRLCDTLGYGLSYPEAVLPRSIPKLVHAFAYELGYPTEWLEWHGHNDFHKVHGVALRLRVAERIAPRLRRAHRQPSARGRGRRVHRAARHRRRDGHARDHGDRQLLPRAGQGPDPVQLPVRGQRVQHDAGRNPR